MNESVPELRAAAKMLGQSDDWPRVNQLARSEARRDRMIAGYALASHLLRGNGGDTATLLVCDPEWQVREAAAFSVRHASIRGFAAVRALLSDWSQTSSPFMHRALLVVARQPRTQGGEVIDEILDLLGPTFRDRHPYVRKNVAFCLRHLSRTHPDRLLPRLLLMATSGSSEEAWCACKGLTAELAAGFQRDVDGILAALYRRHDVPERTLASAAREVSLSNACRAEAS